MDVLVDHGTTAPGRWRSPDALVPCQVEFGADDEVDAVALFPTRLRGHVRPHRAGYGALVGDGDGGVAEIVGALDEFLRVRCAAQEGEVRDRVQFGERLPLFR